MKDYYEILEVSYNASKDMISKAFIVLSKRYHPDVTKLEKKEAEEKFIDVKEAYDCLMDDEKKKEYDEKLKEFKKNQILETLRNKNEESQNNTNTQSVEYDEDEEMRQSLLLKKKEYEEKLNQKRIEMLKHMQDNYYNNLRQMGYKIVEPFDFKRFIKQVLVTVVVILILILIYNFTPVREMTRNYFESYNLSGLFRFFDNIFTLRFLR